MVLTTAFAEDGLKWADQMTGFSDTARNHDFRQSKLSH